MTDPRQFAKEKTTPKPAQEPSEMDSAITGRALDRMKRGDFEGLRFNKTTMRWLDENREKIASIVERMMFGEEIGTKELKEDGLDPIRFFVLLKQVSGETYVAAKDEDERIESLRIYKNYTEKSGRKQDRALQTLLKMGADKGLLTQDAKKAGFSEFSISNAMCVDVRTVRMDFARNEQRAAAIQTESMNTEQKRREDALLEDEEEEKDIAKFSEELHEKRGRRKTDA